MKTWHLLLLVTAVGAAATTYHHARRLPAAPTAAATAKAVPPVEMHEAPPPTPPVLTQTEAPPSPPAAAPSAAPSRLSVNARDPADQAEAVSARDLADQAEAAFRGEPVDRTWAVDAERHLDDALRTIDSGTSEIREVACRTSLCRVETHHADEEAFHAFTQGALVQGDGRTWKGPFFTHIAERDDRGEVVAVTYLVREGGEVPYDDAP